MWMLRALFSAVLLIGVGIVLGVFLDRWQAGTLRRSAVVCEASRIELADLEHTIARSPGATSRADFMRLVEQVQTNIARNCGWLPSGISLPTPNPTEAPKPAAPPR